MGTRHLISVHKDGKYPIAQYGQWDGYPEGQGVDVLSFLHSPLVPALEKNLEKCRWITGEEYATMWKEFGVDIEKDKWVTYEQGKLFNEKYPQLSRDTGAGILELVAKAESEVVLRDDLDFARDSLFCEWAYVVDFDKGTLEVYNGFNSEPLSPEDRFYCEEPMEYKGSTEKLYPIKMVASFPLDNLPTQEEFLQTIAEKFPAPDEDESSGMSMT